MSNTLGRIIRLTSFGESHGPAIGGILDGLPSNMPVNIEEIQQELDRRKPGTSKITSQRKEPDKLEILSGVMEGKSLGTPLGFIIKTADQKSQDYDHLKEVFRPSHADYTWEKKYGIRDHRGGGRSSARETANWVVGGSLVRPILEREGIQISSYVSGIGSIDLPRNYDFYSEEEVYASDTRCPERAMAKRMEESVEEAKENNDSLGGRISCVIKNVPPGLGEPVFDKITSRLGASLLSLNAVKGVEFGAGFLGTTLRGSESNDEIGMDGDKVVFKSNNSGGTLGGLSSGADICFRIGFKPTATIGKKQRTIDKKGNATDLEAHGRHDPCVVPRAVPIVKALASLVISDFIMIDKLSRFSE